MSAGQRPSAQLGVLEPVTLGHRFHIYFHFHVSKLTEIVVVSLVVTRPAKKHIAGRLQHPLPYNHSFALILVFALSCVRFQDRPARLFELKQQWVMRSCHQQGGGAARSDRADSHDLSRDIDNRIAVQDNAAFVRQRVAITLKHQGNTFADAGEAGHVIDKGTAVCDARPAITNRRYFWEFVSRRLLSSFVNELEPALPGGGSLGFVSKEFQIQVRVPDFNRRHFRIFVHALPVRLDSRPRNVLAIPLAEPCLSRREHDACREAFDVPFPRSRQSLIEVVYVKDELPLRSSKATEIRSVAVTARLHIHSGCRCRSQVGSHEGGCATEK